MEATPHEAPSNTPTMDLHTGAAAGRATPQTCDFGSLTIAYDRTVLEPREWTLQQSMWAAELMRDAPAGPMLEMCCGAGQIGLLALRLTGRVGVLVDASHTACHYARHNAHAAGIAERVDVREADVGDALRPDEAFAFVLIDPPWVPSSEVTRFPEDPPRAIDGGDDGLSTARTCIEVACAHLRTGGSILLQLGTVEQVSALEEWFGSPGAPQLDVVEVRRHQDRGVLALLRRR